jgi:hypothetical protein
MAGNELRSYLALNNLPLTLEAFDTFDQLLSMQQLLKMDELNPNGPMSSAEYFAITDLAMPNG